MKTDKKMRVVFRPIKKEETQQWIDEAFDLLFEEVMKREANRKAFI